MIILCLNLFIPVNALEIEAPPVPDSGKLLMPERTDSFADGIGQLITGAMQSLYTDFMEASRVLICLIATTLLISIINLFHESLDTLSRVISAASIGALLLNSTNSMICLAADTVMQLNDYGKLLLPVMATAMAAQGGVTASSGLYMGTTFFGTLLNSFLSDFVLDGVYFYLAISLATAALGEEPLKKIRDTIKNVITWTLKTILTVFTTYMSITGVISGTTDAAALKAMKVTISSFVPVVGGILSDASETVLVSAALMKNAAGLYGIFAVLSIFAGTFIKIGIHYLLLKSAGLVCGIFGPKPTVSLIEDFSVALGILLAVTGSMCLLVLISTVCFMKGVG